MKNFIMFLISSFPFFFYAQGGTTIYEKDDFQYEEIKILDSKALEGSFLDSYSDNSSSNRSGSGIGETPGHLSVSLTGAAQYDIPIAVPSGLNGIAPEVSISYNSQIGNGIAGFGWNINGMSSITRIPSTMFHDNEIDEVNFNYLDRFALDGERLIIKTGSYGANGAQYETENFSNLKIVSYGVSPFGSSYGPAYFIVHYPDGSLAHFGNSSDSRSELEYGITYWQNPQGVRISYEYSKSYNTLSIKKIKYGNLYTGSAFNEVEFTYSTMPDARWEQIYVNQTTVVRSNILTNITCYSSGIRYRQYTINHDETDLKYKRVTSIVEESGNGVSQHSIISFNYADTSESIIGYDITSDLGLAQIEQRNAKVVAFDYSGTGTTDFIAYPNTKDKFWLFDDFQSGQTNIQSVTETGNFETIFPATIVSFNDVILPGQGFTVVKQSSSQAQFKMYAKGVSSSAYLNYIKIWDMPTYSDALACDIGGLTTTKPQRYVSGDFNGDGITDVLALGVPYDKSECWYDTCPDGTFTCCNCNTTTHSNKTSYFIDLNHNITTNFVYNSGAIVDQIDDDDILTTGDFNGDGKTDLVHVKNGKILIYTLDNNNSLLLWQEINDSGINLLDPLLFGDYNGDGKTDFMDPVANNSYSFRMFASNGNGFIVGAKTQPFKYKRTNFNGSNGVLTGYNLIPLDVNGDGRTDIIDYKTTTYNSHDNGTQHVRVYNNEGLASQVIPTHTEFKYSISKTVTGSLKHFPIPVFLPSSQSNKSLDFASISNKWLRQFSFTQDHREDVLMRSVTNNGVTYNIDYSNLNPDETNNAYISVYEPSYNTKTYPYKNINYAPGIKLVSMLERVCSGNTTVQQHYRYNGAVFNFSGLGFVGFEGVAISNWHTSNTDRIFNVKRFDPYMRGAPIATYSQANYGQFSVIPSAGYITKTTFSNSSSLSSSKVFKLWVDSSNHQNALTDTYINSNYTYNDYLNPTLVYTNYSGDGNSTLEKSYSHSTGSNYYIGRIDNETQITTIGSSSFSSEVQYIYSGYLLNERKLKGNGTPFDVESYDYDVFGNVSKKAIKPHNESPRVITFGYDNTGRFITKYVDVEGLVTNYETDNTSGVLISETNPHGLQTNFEYDEWDRLIAVKDYLGNLTTTSYVENQNIYKVTTLSDDGSSSVLTYDKLKRLSKIEEKDVIGQWVGKSFDYDEFDRLYKESEPYIGSGPTQWNGTLYDLYSRPISQNLYTGRTISISYDGLNTTVNDGVKTVKSEADALGNTIAVRDPGGTINYSYYGNGNLKSANYEGVVVQTEQDGWGRKIKMVDPSAGTYEYAYNGFGEITVEKTPKGATDYFYSSTGRLLKKNTIGDNTEVLINYGYDNESKLLTSITMEDEGNIADYIYKYDNYSRLIETFESTEFATFTKEYSYDSFGRIENENHIAKLHQNGKYSKKEIKNNYQNGALKSIQDTSTNNSIWEVHDLNARSQILVTSFGENVYEKIGYDDYGYMGNKLVINDDGSTQNILMELTTDFDSQRGTLNSRTNSMFSWSESFSYDELDRLLTYDDNNGENNNTYDDFGRITFSNGVGDYNYSGTSYQVSDIDLNNQGDLFYQQRKLQQVKFNAFKKPFEINDNEHEKVGFLYNAFQGRSNMFYGDNHNDILERRNRKHYSSDGSMEISYDKETDKSLFVFYIGGDAYSAPVIWRSEQDNSTTTEDYYNLHRDYLGSILMISDREGGVKEKRHFDAWGNIVKLEDGNSNTLDKLTFLDRGYTGHEHLQGVKLIHMNGRLYDPKLKRFLSPDNYIQDISNTQNFNRYGYVLNNPLMYIDPSGETGEDPGYGTQVGIGAALASASLLKGLQIGSWLGNNFDSGVSDVGSFFSNVIEGFYDLLGFSFGSSNENPITVYQNPVNLNMDPLTNSSSGVQASFFGGGGSSTSGLGIANGANVAYAYEVGGGVLKPGHSLIIDLETGIGMEVFHPNNENGVTYHGINDFVDLDRRASIYQTWNVFEPGTLTPYTGRDSFNDDKNFWENGGINGRPRGENGLKLDFKNVKYINRLRLFHFNNYYDREFRYGGQGVCTNYCQSLLIRGGEWSSVFSGFLPWQGNGIFSTYDIKINPPKF